MAVLLITTQEALDELVETKVQALLERTAHSRRARPRPANEKWWMPRFLELLAQCGNISEAVGRLRQEGGPCRAPVYRARESSPRFRRDWDDALHGSRHDAIRRCQDEH